MTTIFPFGPIHPALKEPVGFIFEVEGERIVKAIPNLGFAHRGIEKLLESKTWFQATYIVEHICGICSQVHQSCYLMGVEKLYEKEIPERAAYIRMLSLELERIHSHLLWMGVAFHEAGFDTPFMYTWRDREKVLDIAEAFFGRRVVWTTSRPGGVKRDLTDKVIKMIREFIPYMRKRVKWYEEILTTDKTVLARFRNVGYLDHHKAVELGAVGPVARASGVKRDIRLEDPYYFYKESPFRIVLEKDGDALAKFLVRVKEIDVSLDIIEWVLDNIPKGPLFVNIPPMARPKLGKVISRHEAPRGELIYYEESNGNLRPYRVRVRTPTFANVVSIIAMIEGGYIADIPIVVASIDPCISCMDRVLIIDRKRKKRKIMSKDELIALSRKEFKRKRIKGEII